MPKDGATRAQQKRVSRRASLNAHRDRTGSGDRRETLRSGACDEKCDEPAQGELRKHIVTIWNLGAIARFVLRRKPEIIPEIESFTQQYPELLQFIQNGSGTEVIPQDDIPLFTEWDDEHTQSFQGPGPVEGDSQLGQTSPAPTMHEVGQSKESESAPADSTAHQPKNNLSPPIQEQMSCGQLMQEAIVKDDGLGALPEPLPDGAAPPGSPSAWMPYVQPPSYVPPWPPMPDQISVGAANPMPHGNNTPMFSVPLSFPNGSAAEYGGFPPGVVPLGHPHVFQHLQHGLGVPQQGSRFHPYASYPPSISRAGPNMQQGNVGGSAQSQSAHPGITLRSALDGLAIPQSGSQMSMEMNSNPPWSGQARDVTLTTGDETDVYLNMLC
ncbi:hypothetical protein BDV12DRAFT_203390 [Aspergillus spectabilis]